MESEERHEEQGDAGQQPDPAGTETAPVAAPSPPAQGEADSNPPTEGDVPTFPSDEAADPDASEESAATQAQGRDEPAGVGGTGDHPAPAAMRDETGKLRVAGESPNVSFAGTEAGADLGEDIASGALDPEAREKLNAETEPEQVEVQRPDIGTPE